MTAGSSGEIGKGVPENADLARLVGYAASIIAEHGEVSRTPTLEDGVTDVDAAPAVEVDAPTQAPTEPPQGE